MNPKIKGIIFSVLAIILTVSLLLIIDFSIGIFSPTAVIRQDRKNFLSQAAPLEVSSRYLKANLKRSYNGAEGQPVIKVQTDDYGVLVGPNSFNKKTARFIAFFGGSTTENNEVSEHLRFPYLTGELLSERAGEGFVGLNFGVRGNTSQDATNLFLNHPSPPLQEAEYVVFMENINDRLRLMVSGSYRTFVETSDSGSSEGLWGTLLSAISFGWETMALNFNSIFLIDQWRLNFDERALTRTNERILDELPPLGEQVALSYRQNISRFCSLVKISGQLPILMTQPLRHDSTEQRRFNEIVRSVALEQGVILIDLEKEFASIGAPSDYFLEDGIHFSDSGSAWAARNVSGTIFADISRRASSFAGERGVSQSSTR